LMDHMMPHMDGMEATTIIQSLGYTDPIVALTANTIKGQAEAFVANGFSAFISKPIDVRVLDKYLLQFVRDKQPQSIIAQARAEKKSSEESEHIINDIDSELLLAFEHDLKKAIVDLELLCDSESLLEDDKLKQFITNVHVLKSVRANVRKDALSRIAAELEDAATKGQLHGIKPKAKTLVDELKVLAKSIENNNVFDELEDDEEFINKQLHIITDACSKYDIGTANVAIKELVKSQLSSKNRIYISELATLVLSGNFEKAEALVRKILAGGQ